MNTYPVVIKNVSKTYKDTAALSNITFDVKKSELFGLLGPDGAGKTTLFRILTSLLIPNDGNVLIEGYDVIKDFKQIRNIIGYMPGRFSLYQDLSIEENLKFFATVFGTTIEQNYDLIKDIYIQIEPFKKRLAGKLSGGMKQKLALSCALIHKPKVLILDEPTTGVDAVSRKEFWEMLKRLKEKDITILVSTPYMDEAALCDRVALIQGGKIMQIDTPSNIVKQFKNELYAIRSDNMYALLLDLRNYESVNTVYPFGQYLHYTDRNNKTDINVLYNYLQSKNHTHIEVNIIEPNIEDCFMALMT